VLILALAFIAFFGLVTAAVLQFADAVELQQSHEQSATNEHADTEGAVLFAAAADLQLKDCPNPGVSTTVDGAVATITSCTNENLIPPYVGDCVLGPYLNAVTVSRGSQQLNGSVLVGGNCTDGQGGGTITGIISVDYGP